jgi:hypothetical protein
VPNERLDGGSEEQFLVDGVAPAVIGGGPPESPFDLEPEPAGRHHGDGPLQVHRPAPRAPGAGQVPIGTPFGQPGTPNPYDHTQHPGYARSAGREPPTAPIPVLSPPPAEQQEEKRKSWVSKVFRLPGN